MAAAEAAKGLTKTAHACGSEAAADDATACAIPDAAAALLAELEAWPALAVVRGALDEAHPPAGERRKKTAADAESSALNNNNNSNGAGGGCSARSSAAASVAGRADVAHAAAVAARGQRELESYGLLPERLALLLAAAVPPAAAAGGNESSSSSSSSSSPPSWPAEARKLLTPPQGSVLAAEVSYLRAQWKELPALDAASAASAKAARGCGCGS